MAAVNEAVLIINMPKKLKHIALKEVHYQLVNTCLIILSIGWRYCNCWRYHGCREWPTHCNLFGERNYCLICQIKKTLNLDKIYNLDKIQRVVNNFISFKKELLIFLNSGYINFWLCHYSQQYKLGTKRRKHNNMYLRNYIDQNYYNIYYLDP